MPKIDGCKNFGIFPSRWDESTEFLSGWFAKLEALLGSATLGQLFPTWVVNGG
jgi:hypothetical protein